jgi:DNA-binding NtrC family response regulator
VADLPKRIHWYMEDLKQPQENEPIQLDEFLRSIEQRLVNRALELANGNKAQAARLLGITRTRVIRRVAESGSENPE